MTGPSGTRPGAHPDAAAGPPGPPLPHPGRDWAFRVAEPHGADLDLVVRWMRAPHVARYWRQPWDARRWAQEIRGQRAGRHTLPCFAVHREWGEPVGYLELYRVHHDRLRPHYPAGEHDLGVHLAIGDLARTGQGLGTAVLRAVAAGLLAADPECRRVVAEPDAGNASSVRAFAAAGFVACGPLSLPEKDAVLMIRPRTEEDLPR